jgi:hypothetical protein
MPVSTMHNHIASITFLNLVFIDTVLNAAENYFIMHLRYFMAAGVIVPLVNVLTCQGINYSVKKTIYIESCLSLTLGQWPIFRKPIVYL